jgi:hypothetical protein
MSSDAPEQASWYAAFLDDAERARHPERHPEVAAFLAVPANLDKYLAEVTSPKECLRYLPKTVFEPVHREALVGFLARRGAELRAVPRSLLSDDRLVRAALDSFPSGLRQLDAARRDDQAFVLPYLLREPTLTFDVSTRLQRDPALLALLVRSTNERDILGVLPSGTDDPALVAAARLAILEFTAGRDAIDEATLTLRDDNTWSFGARSGSKQYVGGGYNDLDLVEVSASGRWELRTADVVRLTPAGPMACARRFGQDSGELSSLPGDPLPLEPLEFAYADLAARRVPLAKQLGAGARVSFALRHGVPGFLRAAHERAAQAAR